MTTKPRRKGPSATELKRQLAEARRENKANKEVISAQNEQIAASATQNEDTGGLEYVSKNAKDTPAIIRNHFEPEEHQVGQDNPRELKSTGPASEALEPALIEPVDRPVSTDKLEMLRFMEEEVLVMVHETTNEQDVPIPEVTNDGKNQFFIRGEEQLVKRKFIEILARCKKTAFSQRLQKDGAGNDTYVQIPHTALMYPFSVLQDNNPRGRDWLKAILSEA